MIEVEPRPGPAKRRASRAARDAANGVSKQRRPGRSGRWRSAGIVVGHHLLGGDQVAVVRLAAVAYLDLGAGRDRRRSGGPGLGLRQVAPSP